MTSKLVAAMNAEIRPMKTAAETALCRPHQIKPLILLRAVGSIAKHFRRVFETTFAESDVAQTRARGGAKATRLTQLCDHRQSAAAGIERILKMFARRFEILVRERNAAHAEFERHINNRDPILIEFFLCLE